MAMRCTTRPPALAPRAPSRAPSRSSRRAARVVASSRSRSRGDGVDAPATSADDRSPPALVAASLAALVALEPACASLSLAGSALGASGFASPPPASAALSNPNTRLPRNGVAALRRAVPAINPEAGRVQSKLEEAAYLLRIPQRKPWGTMSGDVSDSLAIVRNDREKLLEPVPSSGADRDAALATLDEIEQLLVELGPIAQAQDVERFDRGVAMSLDAVSRLRVLQAPGLPFDLPRRYDSEPRLAGRAVVDFSVRKKSGETFGFVGGDEVKTATLRVVVDGYNAPLTAGNFVDNARRGCYDGVELKSGETAIFAGGNEARRRRDAPAALPLEVKPVDDYEPRYRSPLNVMGAEELPTLPMSVNGALAMARGAEDGTADATRFFVYKFDKRSAGLGGLAFEEGEFSVFGYVVNAEEEGFLAQLATGDVIVKAKVVSGLDRLQNGGEEPAAEEPTPGEGEEAA